MSNIIDLISKEQFLAVYNKYPISKWSKFSFRYFSYNTLQEDRWLAKIFVGVFMLFFFLGAIGVVFELNKIFTGICIILMALVLLSIAIIMNGGAIKENLRIRKIKKELKITKREYDILATCYLMFDFQK